MLLGQFWREGYSWIDEQAVDLGEDLTVAETRPGDRSGRAGSHTGTAALAKRLVDLRNHLVFMEQDRIERAQIIADPAARALLLVDRGTYRLKLQLAAFSQREL